MEADAQEAAVASPAGEATLFHRGRSQHFLVEGDQRLRVVGSKQNAVELEHVSRPSILISNPAYSTQSQLQSSGSAARRSARARSPSRTGASSGLLPPSFVLVGELLPTPVGHRGQVPNGESRDQECQRDLTGEAY